MEVENLKKIIILAAVVVVLAVLATGLAMNLTKKPRSGGESQSGGETTTPESSTEEGSHYTFNSDWLKKGNIWVFFQPPLDYLQKVRATGTTWSVYFGGVNDHDRDYIEMLHRNGFRVCSNFPTVQSSITEDELLKKEASCRDLYGNPIEFLGTGQYAMCGNNPEWQKFLINRIEEHARGGVDAILLDEIGDTGQFCDYCMQVFNTYLAEHYSADALRELFGIEDISSFNYRQYLLDHGATSEYEDPNPKLTLEYFQAKYWARARFIEELIQHAKDSAGWNIPVAGNTYGLFPNQQIYVPHLDFVIFEMPITPEDHPWLDYLRPVPGKHLTTYFLAEALDPEKPFTAFPDVWDLARLSEDEFWLWRHWLAEARACGASFLIPWMAYTYGGGAYTLDPESISPYTDFFANHPQYYENLERVASVAVLHDLHSTLRNQFTWLADLSWRSFENVGIVLQEAHIPFEVAYRGDGVFVQRPLTLEGLQKYKAVIVPKNYDLDGGAQDLLSQYIATGGLVLRCDELPDDSAIVPTLRSMLDPGLETDAPADVGMVIYRRGDSLLVHLINYSYNGGARDFLEQGNFKITLSIPAGVSLEGKTLKLVSPDAEEVVLDYSIHEGRVTFTVPSIHCYSIASFE